MKLLNSWVPSVRPSVLCPPAAVVPLFRPNAKAAAYFIFVCKTVLVFESEFFKVKPSLLTAL
jgi:hypothetical protein